MLLLVYNTLTVLCEKSKIVFFSPSYIKNIVVSPTQYRFPVKLICCIAIGSASSILSLLRSIAIGLCLFSEIRIMKQATS